MNPDLVRLLWPPSRLGEALQTLAAKWDQRLETPSAIANDWEALGEWLESAAAWLGLETQAVETPYADFDRQVSAMGPALLRMHDGFLVVCKSRYRSAVTVLAPDGKRHKVAPVAIRSAICGEMEGPVAE